MLDPPKNTDPHSCMINAAYTGSLRPSEEMPPPSAGGTCRRPKSCLFRGCARNAQPPAETLRGDPFDLAKFGQAACQLLPHPDNGLFLDRSVAPNIEVQLNQFCGFVDILVVEPGQ